MNKLNLNFKEIKKGILIIGLYFLLQVLLSIPFVFLIQKKIINYEIANLLIYFLLTLFFIIIYIKDLINDFKDFKKNYKRILKITIKYWLKGLFIMLVSSFFITQMHLEINNNQATNINLLNEMPFFEIICAAILAPILEELVFRKGLKKSTTNKHLYAISTGLLFGMIHVTSSISSISDLIMLVYLIPYSAVGIAFGYAYSKTDNIYGTMAIHAFHNIISLGLLIIGG